MEKIDELSRELLMGNGLNYNTDRYGHEMYELIKIIYPVCRSITGDGVRETLKIIREYIPLEIKEIPSGTPVYDWVVPEEWNIEDAYIKNSKGEKIVDFKKSNLHVLNYSTPVHEKMSLAELKKYLHTLPDHPDEIPYLSSYYKRRWGFCLSHKQYQQLEEDIYEVFINSTFTNGFLTYGELYLKGESEEEILFSSYLCHPSLCNDNLSGPVLLTFLAKHLKNVERKYSYRFLFIPETIGAIVWLNLNEDRLSLIKHGLVATCVGDSGNPTYKRSRMGNAVIDKAVERALIDSGEPYEIIDFDPSDGSDERQFCSPGFNLPVGSLMRTVYGRFPQYHTSADNLDFMSAQYLADSFKKYMEIIFILENNESYISLNPKCEPQLGKRGLYRLMGQKGMPSDTKGLFWVLNFSDGANSLMDISFRSGLSFRQIKNAADVLLDAQLLCKRN